MFLSHFAPVNLAVSGGATVTFSGSGFGDEPSPSHVASVFGCPCADTSWVSATALTCVAAAVTCEPAAGAESQGGDVAVAYAGASAAADGMAVDAPVLTAVAPHNFASAAPVTLSVFGTNFPASAGSLWINDAECDAAEWRSDSVAACAAVSVQRRSEADPPSSSIEVLLADGRASVALGLFTLDVPPPRVTAITPPNSPLSGGAVLTLRGVGFEGGCAASRGSRPFF